MTPRDAIQFRQLMTEEAAAQALVMKGEFNKEIKTLSELIAEWDKRGKIDARLKDLAAQTSAFQKEAAEFDNKVAGFEARLTVLASREEKVSARESAAAVQEAEAIRKMGDLANARDKHEAQVKADTEALGRERADIALQQADIQAQRGEIEAREKAVADKLKALKALV